VDAQTALAWGLVDEVAAEDAFPTRIEEMAARVCSMAQTSVRLTKRLTNAAFDMPFDAVVQTYLEYQRQAMASPEHQQAMAEHRAARAGR
jgi:enoyl-CoA hydratase/carnithine racemase